MVKSSGRLEVVATPIGNLRDLSDRARESLSQADIIAAEDTRHTQILLRSIGVARPLVSLHAHNEAERVPELLARLGQGETVVLVSDAGTPLLSDPGFELVRRAAAAGYEIHSIPGPSAITAALAVAAIPTDRFCFEGFLPAKDRERRARLSELAHEPRTLVFFEAPHRIAATLDDLSRLFGPLRPVALARELTKLHETIYRGTLAELSALTTTEPNLSRGEITLVVQGAPSSPATSAEATGLLHRTLEVLLRSHSPSQAAALAAQITQTKRSTAYALALKLTTTKDDKGAESDTPPR